MDHGLTKKELNYLASEHVAEIDYKTLSYELKNNILKYIIDFMKRLKVGIKIIDISAGFGVMEKQFEGLRDRVKKEMGLVSMRINSNDFSKVGAITDPKRILGELQTLFKYPVLFLIMGIRKGIITDQEILNYLDVFVRDAEFWKNKTQW